MASLIDILGLSAGAIGGAIGARDERVVAERAAEQQTLLDALKRKQEDEDRAQRNRYMEAQIRNFESLDRERNTPQAPKPVAPILPPWQREGFDSEDAYIRFRQREAGATRPPQSPTQAAGPVLSEGERKTGALYQTAVEGYNTLEALLADNVAPPTLIQRGMSKVGLGVGNVLSPDQLRQMDQAGYSLAEAWLRLTSGGAITPDEIENVKGAIIPQPGDDPTTLESKRRLRATYINAIRSAAGRGIPQEPQQTSPMRPDSALSPNAGRVPVAQRYNLERP